MVGREVVFTVKKKPAQPGDVVLDLQGLCAENDRGVPALRNFNLTVRAGEIVGLAGVAGNGQSELAQVDHRAPPTDRREGARSTART